LQDFGDMLGQSNEWIVIKGQSRRLKGFSILRSTPTQDFRIKYFAHIQNIGDTIVMR